VKPSVVTVTCETVSSYNLVVVVVVKFEC